MAESGRIVPMKSHKKLKIGFIGVGGMGQCAHLRNYASSSMGEECEVVALAEIRPNLAKEVAGRYGVPRVYESHEQLLANEKLDAIVASQPFSRHGLLVPELAKAGIPIFTEKPIAGAIKAGEKNLRALEENKTWLMLGATTSGAIRRPSMPSRSSKNGSNPASSERCSTSASRCLPATGSHRDSMT